MNTIIIILCMALIAFCIPFTVKMLYDGYVWLAAGVFIFMLAAEAGLLFLYTSYNMEPSITSSTFSEIELTDMDKVNEELRKFISSMGPDDPIEIRKENTEKVFEDLVERGLVKEYQYDDSSELFTFTYSNGVLGGLRISDFGEDVNGVENTLDD